METRQYMRNETEINNPAIHGSATQSRLRRRSESQRKKLLYSILAAFGVFGGISSLFVGIVFVILHGIVSDDTIFDRVGTGLLIAAIPMILMGSIFIDKAGDSNV